MAKLIVLKAPSSGTETDAGRTMELPACGPGTVEFVIGRSTKAGFCLNHAKNASRTHAKILCERGGYSICDLSSHGTKLNGMAVSKDPARPDRLRSGDKIFIADEFVIEFENDASALVESGTTVNPVKLPEPAPVRPPDPPIPVAKPPEPARPETGWADRIKLSPPAQNVSERPPLVRPPTSIQIPPRPDAAPPVAPPPSGSAGSAGSGRSAPAADSAKTAQQPVYLLLDGSGSMAGEPIEALKAGIASLLAQIKQNPACRDVVELSVVFFGTDVSFFPHPLYKGTSSEGQLRAFKPSGLCGLGAGILQALRVHAPVAERKRPPLFFVALDGVATDTFDDAVRALQRENGLIVACELGALGDVSPLAGCAQQLLSMKSFDKPACENLMRWLGELVAVLAKDGISSDRTQLKWPSLPAGISRK